MLDKCTNCRVYNWVQPAPSILQKCGQCKIVQYCSIECQAEHWKACHKSHCSKLKAAREAWRKGDELVDLGSHHPFPATGTPEDATEVLVFLALRVYGKMLQTNHPAISIKADLLKELWSKLAIDNLVDINMSRKIFPPTHNITDEIDDCVDFMSQTSMLFFDEIGDQVGLWSTLLLILGLKSDLRFLRQFYNLKEPLVSVPEKLWQGVDRDVGVFSSILEQIIAIFYRGPQIPPFKELLKIVCGGSLTQACTFCNSQIVVEAIAYQAKGMEDGPSVLVVPHLFRIFHCRDKSCMQQTTSQILLVARWKMAVSAARARLAENRCDFCFKLSEKVHR